MDKIVEIARFTYPADAQPLMALLRSEGIECYLRNELSSQIMAGYVDVGGARVEILESDVPRAMKIMEEGGYDLPREDEQAEPVETSRRIRTSYPFSTKISLRETNHDPIRHRSCLFGFGDLFRIAYFLKLNKCNQWHAER